MMIRQWRDKFSWLVCPFCRRTHQPYETCDDTDAEILSASGRTGAASYGALAASLHETQRDTLIISQHETQQVEERDQEEDRVIDEFDKYRDPKVEALRASLERTLPDSNDMTSRAILNRLFDDSQVVVYESGNSYEIEATVLCEAADFLRRTQEATLDQR